MADLIPPDFTALDRAALCWFVLAWLGYGHAINSGLLGGSITARMDGVRRAWMHTMLGRDNRIVDASLLGHTVHSATFFASTTMVALAGLIGALGAFDHGFVAMEALSITAGTSRRLAEGKLLLLLLVFAHTFLKLGWALRQLNYCLALIGAAPQKPTAAERERLAHQLGTVLSLAIRAFNAGIRGYQFALAALAWLMGPVPFVVATTGMVAMLLWRQFGSATAVAIRQGEETLVEPHAWRSGATPVAAGGVGP